MTWIGVPRPRRGLLIRGAHHTLGQINADRFTRRANMLRGREKHGTTAGCYVKDALSGRNAKLRHKTLPEMGKRPLKLPALLLRRAIVSAFRASASSLMVSSPLHAPRVD
jgi:hypothetical protein